MTRAYFFRKLRNLFSFREDYHTQLGSFLRRGHLPARLANMVFNTACKTAKECRRLARHQRVGDQGGVPRRAEGLPSGGDGPLPLNVCALIAEVSIPQCLHYRVTERAAQLRLLGWEVHSCAWNNYEKSLQILQLASCVLFYRVPMMAHVPALYAEARRLGLPVLFDIDDLIFEREQYAAHLALSCLSKSQTDGLLELADRYREAMEAADVLLSSTKTLDACAGRAVGKKADGDVPHGHVVHNSIADEMVALSRNLPPKVRHEEEIRLFYGSGSDTHDADFALVAAALREAMEQDRRLHLHVHGYLDLPPAFESCTERVHHIAFLDKNTYYRTIAEYDIALMPLTPEVFNDAKSNIKYQEASLFGIPSIASPAAEFLEAITDGVDGFIARTPEQWRDSILRLASDPALRAAMGEKARLNVLARYANPAIAEHELCPALPVAENGTGKRLLLVNVLFGLSSFGGATMVVEDTARELRRQGFEVFVFSTVRRDDVPAGGLLRYGWNGVSVVAHNTCLGDAEQEGGETEKCFRRTLRAIRPDLVHFHCIQGMSLGLLHTCARYGIPYAITMHDAWWVCPRQFMLDTSGNYCAQETVDPELCRARCDLADPTLHRRRVRMREAVYKAAVVFTPSDFQTAFVRRNFPRCHDVRTNRNGIFPPVASRPPREKGPLRLGYLGGKARHKGYFFLAEALRGLEEENFELLLVDLHTVFGEGAMASAADRALWKKLPVRIVPFVPHAAIDELYAQMDVLLFPSLWDESFGLTVREAILRDVFVISSDCGGPREAIAHGKNGLLFPKGDLEAFRDHLRCVLRDQDRFKSYQTAHFGDVRGVEEQARELAEAYGEMLRRGRPTRRGRRKHAPAGDVAGAPPFQDALVPWR